MFLNRFNGIIFNERKFIQTPPSMPSVVFWNLGAATNFFFENFQIEYTYSILLLSFYSEKMIFRNFLKMESLKEWKKCRRMKHWNGIHILAVLGKFIALLDQVVDVVLVAYLYVVAMVTIVADMDHVNKGIPYQNLSKIQVEDKIEINK